MPHILISSRPPFRAQIVRISRLPFRIAHPIRERVKTRHEHLFVIDGRRNGELPDAAETSALGQHADLRIAVGKDPGDWRVDIAWTIQMDAAAESVGRADTHDLV